MKMLLTKNAKLLLCRECEPEHGLGNPIRSSAKRWRRYGRRCIRSRLRVPRRMGWLFRPMKNAIYCECEYQHGGGV